MTLNSFSTQAELLVSYIRVCTHFPAIMWSSSLVAFSCGFASIEAVGAVGSMAKHQCKLSLASHCCAIPHICTPGTKNFDRAELFQDS